VDGISMKKVPDVPSAKAAALQGLESGILSNYLRQALIFGANIATSANSTRSQTY